QTELAREVVGLEQAGEARLGVGAGLDVGRDRQQRLVAPDVGRAGLDVASGQRRELVGDLERSETLRTGVRGTQLDLGTTLTTRQGGGVAERTLADTSAHE